MFLRNATVQDKDLVTLYTSYLSAKRVAGGVVQSHYTPDYAEFFSVIKHHAELLDSTNAHQRSNSSRQTRSQSRAQSNANIADSFHDLNVSDSFDSTTNEEVGDESLQAFLSEQQYGDDDVKVLQAFAAFQQRRAPKKGGVKIPWELYGSLPVEFKKGWDSLTGEQQQKIAKDSFPKNDEREQTSSQVQVYQAQYIPSEDIAAMYLVSQASLSYDDDSS